MEIRAIEELYRRYGSSVYRRARAILGNEHRAQDAMHEVFIRALCAQEAWQDSSSPVAWLYRVTTNYCLNLIRNEKRRAELLAQEGGLLEPRAEAPGDVRLTLKQVLLSVEPELREVAICFHLDGMTQTEAAEHLGVSRRTVGYRLQALREVLRSSTSEGTTER